MSIDLSTFGLKLKLSIDWNSHLEKLKTVYIYRNQQIKKNIKSTDTVMVNLNTLIHTPVHCTLCKKSNDISRLQWRKLYLSFSHSLSLSLSLSLALQYGRPSFGSESALCEILRKWRGADGGGSGLWFRNKRLIDSIASCWKRGGTNKNKKKLEWQKRYPACLCFCKMRRESVSQVWEVFLFF